MSSVTEQKTTIKPESTNETEDTNVTKKTNETKTTIEVNSTNFSNSPYLFKPEDFPSIQYSVNYKDTMYNIMQCLSLSL